MTNEGCSRCRILLIGPMPPRTTTRADPIGGGAVNFAETVRQLRVRDIELEVLDSSRPRTYLSRWRVMGRDISAFLKIARGVMRRLRWSHVVYFNTSAGRAWLSAAAIWAICRVGRRPLALRFFGGDVASKYEAYGPIRRWWAENTYMRCALVFVQTKMIYSRFGGRSNFRWFPNTRDVHMPSRRLRTNITKLLFYSRLNMDKGVGEAVDACRNLPGGCHLNVFGPGMPDTDFSLFEANDSVTYCGVLNPADVPEILADHDVLLFPSYWKSEGYPGVVIEALQCAMPVITTRWAGIPEVVEHEKSGLLIEPRSAAAVREAIERLIEDPGLYQTLCAGARSRGELFRSVVWYDRMAGDLCGLARRDRRER